MIKGFWGDAGESIDVYYEVIDHVRRHGVLNDTRAVRAAGVAMRLVVTGGAGFIGSGFVRMTLATYPDDEVVVFDKLTYAGNLANLASVERPAPLPVRARRHRRRRGGPARCSGARDAVVNFAAETHVDRSILDAGDFVQTDVFGTWVLTEAARNAGVKRFVQISTDEVYGAVASGASRESDRLDPTSPYSASKAGGELLVGAAIKTFGLPAAGRARRQRLRPVPVPGEADPAPHHQRARRSAAARVRRRPAAAAMDVRLDDFVSGVDAVLRRGVLGEVYNVGNPEPEADLPLNLDGLANASSICSASRARC